MIISRLRSWWAELTGPARYDWDGESQVYRPRPQGRRIISRRSAR